jgi:hypothetical protein
LVSLIHLFLFTAQDQERRKTKNTISALDPPTKGNVASEHLSLHWLSIRIGPRSGTQDHTGHVSVLCSRKWLPADITLRIFRTRPLRRPQYCREDKCANQLTNLINRSLEKQQTKSSTHLPPWIGFDLASKGIDPTFKNILTEASTTPMFLTFDDMIEPGPTTSVAYPLESLSDNRFWETTIVRSAIVSAIGNIRATAERCCSDFQYGQQSSNQLQVRTQVIVIKSKGFLSLPTAMPNCATASATPNLSAVRSKQLRIRHIDKPFMDVLPRLILTTSAVKWF